MKPLTKRLLSVLVAVLLFSAIAFSAYAAEENLSDTTTAVTKNEQTAENNSEVQDDTTSSKAWAAALVVGLAAVAGAISMGIAIGKTAESISRQPEAEGKIRSAMMLGLVFIETVVIYALIVAILLIFVL